MNEYLVLSDVSNLRFKPLVYCVFRIDPLPNLEISLLQIKLLQILKVLRIFRSMRLSLRSTISIGPFSKSIFFSLIYLILDHIRLFEWQLRLDEWFYVVHGSAQDVEGLCLIKPQLLQMVPRILLENESAISSQDARFVEGSHYFLD